MFYCLKSINTLFWLLKIKYFPFLATIWNWFTLLNLKASVPIMLETEKEPINKRGRWQCLYAMVNFLTLMDNISLLAAIDNY